MAKLVIGLTGGIASGKTTVTNMFIDLGIEVVDADIVAREVVEPNSPALNAIKAHFGDDILAFDGSLDRAKLRSIIFDNDSEKQWLNSLLHPLIRSSMTTQLKQCKSQYCILSAPLLLENNLSYLVDRVLVVDVNEQTQLTRAMSRDNNNETLIKNIINSQLSRKERLDKADDIIDNQALSIDALKNKVLSLHQAYLSLSN